MRERLCRIVGLLLQRATFVRLSLAATSCSSIGICLTSTHTLEYAKTTVRRSGRFQKCCTAHSHSKLTKTNTALTCYGCVEMYTSSRSLYCTCVRIDVRRVHYRSYMLPARSEIGKNHLRTARKN